jgi:hypothetical protein
MEKQTSTCKEVLNNLYKAQQEKQPQTANKIAVDKGIQLIKEYKNTGYLSWDGAAILVASGIILIVNTITNIVSLIKIGNTVRRNAITYLSDNHFKETDYIEGILRELLIVSDSDRVCLGVLHNGEYWGSKHFTKMTIAYETKKSGINSIKYLFRGVDIEKISSELKSATHTEFTNFNRIDSNLSTGCKEYLDTLGIKSVSTRLLRSKEGVYGILELQKLSERDLKINSVKSQQQEEIFNKLSWAMDRVRKGQKIYR